MRGRTAADGPTLHDAARRTVRDLPQFEQALPNHVALVQGRALFLNLIDPRGALFMSASFIKFLDFADVQWEVGREPN